MAKASAAPSPAQQVAAAAAVHEPVPQVSDSDFTVESASAPQDLPVEDTTARTVPAPAAVVAPTAATADEGDDDGADEPIATAPAASAAGDGTAQPVKQGGRKTLSQRTAEKRAELDRVTWEVHQAKRELAAAKASSTQPAPEVTPRQATPKADAAPVEMPKVPNYREFDTDADYESAMTKYYTDLGAYMDGRLGSVQTQAVSAVDRRMANQQAETNSTAVLTRARAKYADWGAKAEALGGIRSSWYNPEAHGISLGSTPFLSELVASRLSQGKDEGSEMLYFLGSNPEQAQALADLQPTAPVRAALLKAPELVPLLSHFATAPGQQEWNTLVRMHPDNVAFAIGALSARLQAASSGSASPAVEPITKALPSTRPQVGDAGARREPGGKKDTFESWMQAEDAREKAEKLRQAGLPA